jgi:hypothetical protein
VEAVMIGEQLSIFNARPAPPLTDDERVDRWVEEAYEQVKHLPKELQIEIALKLQMSCLANKMTSATKARLATDLLQTLE